MKKISVTRELTAKDATTVIGDEVPQLDPTFNGETLAYDEETGALVCAYVRTGGTRALRRALKTVEFAKFNRARDYGSQSTTFGYAPRRPVLGREGCAMSKTRRENPETEHLLEQLADHSCRQLQEIAPDIVAADRKTLEKINNDWKIGEEKLWTSGVINNTSQLPYHRDNLNFPCWSAMPVLRRGVRGGHLHLPEYGIVVPCRDGYTAFFKGKELVHGVTPIYCTEPDGYRYSVVFYALQGMKDCFTHAKEQAYAQKRRTQRVREMAQRLKAGFTGIPGRD